MCRRLPPERRKLAPPKRLPSYSGLQSLSHIPLLPSVAQQYAGIMAPPPTLPGAQLPLPGSVNINPPPPTAPVIAPPFGHLQTPATASMIRPAVQPGTLAAPVAAVPLPAQLHSLAPSLSLPQQLRAAHPTVSSVPTAVAFYQPPAATAAEIQGLQASLGVPQPGPSHHLQLAPTPHTLPTLPSKLTAKVLNGEFVDFAEIFQAIDSEEGDEPPLEVELGEGRQLTLSRKPRRKEVKDFGVWSKCFCVYAATVCCQHPTRGPDLFAYHYIIACAYWEFLGNAWLTYDTAFRKKAAKFHISQWGERDLQLYNKTFVGVKRRNTAHCAICLSTSHATADCSLYQEGPAKKSKSVPAGPRAAGVPWHAGREVCLNWNRGKCADTSCPMARAHVCSNRGCQGAHKSTACPNRRASPRKHT